MSRVTELTLHAYAIDALDGEVRAWVDERLAADPTLRARLAEVRAALTPPAPSTTPRWNVPPTWMGRDAKGPVLQVLTETLGGSFPSGDSVEVELHRSLEAHGDDVVVVLHRAPSGWEVLFPQRNHAMRTLRQLPRSRGGLPVLGLTVTAVSGRQRWAVVLVPPDVPIRWTGEEADRWSAVRDALRARQLVVEVVEVDVG